MEYKAKKFDSLEDRRNFLYENFTGAVGVHVLNIMTDRGFLEAPASTRYHGNYAGGLFDHSVNVALILEQMSKELNLTWMEEDSALRIGLLHDLCKIDSYKLDKATQVWEHRSTLVKGHGVKSVIYAAEYGANLTEEERACILYHMGAYTPKEEWQNYNDAVRIFPNVLWTHTADMVASHIIGV